MVKTVLVIAAALILAACGTSSDSVCAPGATQSCLCPGGGQGVQTCTGDGKGWATCAGCGTSPDASSGCTPDAKRCSSNDVEKCAADGRSWVFYKSCAAAEKCSAGICEAVPASCGDKKCDASTESCNNCPADCGSCCGNGKCESQYGETSSTCPLDCGGIKPDLGPGKPDLGPGKPDLPPSTVPGTWVRIPPTGNPPFTFTMGSPSSEPCREAWGYKETQHQVTLSQAFQMSTTHVTQGQFQQVLGYNPSSNKSCGNSCPVEMISWHEAAAYCNALSTLAGLTKCYSCTSSGQSVSCQEVPAYGGNSVYSCPGYRLPTEAEFEFAVRAGTTTAYYSGPNTAGQCSGTEPNLAAIGWYDKNSGGAPHPGGQKQPNAWGLYDMSGNMWARCHDWWVFDLGSAAVTNPVNPSGNQHRSLRGGAFDSPASYLRSAWRHPKLPNERDNWAGVRCARSL